MSPCLSGTLSDMHVMSGIDEAVHKAACVVIDKMDKLPVDKLTEELQQLGVKADEAKTLLALIGVSTIGTSCT
jgi:hypothetical protein